MEPNITSTNPPLPSTQKISSAANEIRTMKTDIADAIKGQNETLVSIALAEKRQKEEALKREDLAREQEAQIQKEEAPKRRGRIFLVATVFIFIIIILSAGWASFKFLLPKLNAVKLPSFSIPKRNPPPVEQLLPIVAEKPVITLAPSLIPAQSEKELDTSKSPLEHIFALIAVERTAGLASGNIENLYFNNETRSLSANEFLAFAGVGAPEILTRSLEDPFMAGLFGEEGEATPFLILKVSSYETGLAGMLAWEKNIPSLLTTMFGTKIEAETIKKSAFHNIVVLGRDARLFGADPRQSVAYAFADANTIVIAGSQNALGKIMLIVTGK